MPRGFAPRRSSLARPSTRAKSLAAMPFGCKHETESDDLEPQTSVVATGAKRRPRDLRARRRFRRGRRPQGGQRRDRRHCLLARAHSASARPEQRAPGEPVWAASKSAPMVRLQRWVAEPRDRIRILAGSWPAIATATSLSSASARSRDRVLDERTRQPLDPAGHCLRLWLRERATRPRRAYPDARPPWGILVINRGDKGDCRQTTTLPPAGASECAGSAQHGGECGVRQAPGAVSEAVYRAVVLECEEGARDVCGPQAFPSR